MASTPNGQPVWGGSKSKNPKSDGIRVDAGPVLDDETIKKLYPDDSRKRRRCRIQINKDPEAPQLKTWLKDLGSTHEHIAIMDVPVDDEGRPSIDFEEAEDLEPYLVQEV